ncbi:type II CAAX endopeptidase family protein [Microbacterium sediminicola]|uniref:Type II CAAX endopeptidase family protein n=1 Tax=Microbacterium sediminicola TaxID=415210 RepID=A0ABP4TEU4_9MICO
MTTDPQTLLIEQRERFAFAMREAKRPTGPWIGLLVAIGLFASLSAVSILVVLLAQAVPAIAAFAVSADLVVQGVTFIVVWILLWVWMRFKERRAFASIGFREPRRGWVQAVRGFAIGVLAMALIVAIAVGTGNMRFLTLPDGNPFAWAALGWVLVAIPVFVIQGGAEELINRGYLVQTWMPRYGLVSAVIVQAVFFTLAHSLNPGMSVFSVAALLLVSVLLVFWALSEGSLWGVVAFHAAWNWAQGGLFGVKVSGNPVENSLLAVAETDGANSLISGGEFGLEASVVTLVVLAGMSAVAIVVYVRGQRRGVAVE